MDRFKLTEQPGIYVVLLMFSLLIYLINLGFFKDETLTHTVTILTILIFASYIIYASFKTRFKINTIHRNTGQALVYALVMIAIIFVSSTVIGLFLGFAGRFMEANAIAMIGAFPRLLIESHKLLTFLVFFILIPIPETIIAINILDLMLSSVKSNYTLRDIKVWVASGVIGGGAILYHTYAKFIPYTGTLNIHALIIVFVLFTLTGIFAVKTKEMEAPIYAHMGNNGIALWGLLKGAIRFA